MKEILLQYIILVPEGASVRTQADQAEYTITSSA